MESVDSLKYAAAIYIVRALIYKFPSHIQRKINTFG